MTTTPDSVARPSFRFTVWAALAFACLTSGLANAEPEGGRFQVCPASPNCVSTRATDELHRVEPFAFEGPPEAAFDRLREIVKAEPRTRIVTDEAGYVHAVFITRWLRFRDDVEFQLDADDGVIHVRSASRVGYGDMGVNRARVESLRAAFAAEKTASDRESEP